MSPRKRNGPPPQRSAATTNQISTAGAATAPPVVGNDNRLDRRSAEASVVLLADRRWDRSRVRMLDRAEALPASEGVMTLPYGTDYPDTDLFADVDGTVYSGRGPFERRPLRLLRRKAAHYWARRWRR